MSQRIQDFKIRYGKPSDLDAIIGKVQRVISFLFPSELVDVHKIKKLFDKALENEEFSLIVLVDPEDKVRGYIFASIDTLYFNHRRIATCLSIWVDEDCRGHSLDMIRAFNSWARFKLADSAVISSFDNLTPKGTDKIMSWFGFSLKEKQYWKDL